MDNEDNLRRPSPSDLPPVVSQADLHRVWRLLMGELGFAAPQLWVLFLDDDGQVTPAVTHVEDLPQLPDERFLTNLMDICDQVLEGTRPGGSVAFLYARPGGSERTYSDRAWALSLTVGAGDAGLDTRPVHLANDRTLTVFAYDDFGWPETG